MQKAEKNTLIIWFILIILTAVTYGFGKAGLGGTAVVMLLLSSIMLKGQLVASYFMELKSVRAPWRWVVTGWLIFVVSMIGVAFLL